MDYQIDPDGIVTLTWDLAGCSLSAPDDAGGTEFWAAVERALGDAAVKGLLIVPAQTDALVDDDFDMLLRADDARTLFDRVMRRSRKLRAVETAGKPVAAALPGSALGDGLEVALACHYRVAADDDRARFGLTQVTVGLMPGGGGTQRLPRLIGMQRALPLLLEGKRLTARTALDAGILHEVVPAGEQIEAARRWLLGPGRQRPQQPWDGKGYRPPGGGVQAPAGIQTFMAGNAMLRAKTGNHYPALRNVMACVYEGVQTDIDTGLKIEARYFTGTALTSETKNMLRLLHFGMKDAKGLAGRPQTVPTQEFTRVGVLGAGMMGAGIAYATAASGLGVVLLDTTPEAADRGKAYAENLLARQVEKGATTAKQGDAMLQRITSTTDFADLDGCELVIEAVFEDRTIKADVTRKAEAALGSSAIFASNTSTLPITGLAQASERPSNFIGLHFFSPVERMALVEVIVGRQTSEETLARSMDYVRAIGKTPIVVRDARGFYTSRVFAAYLAEGLAMLAQGVKPALIDNAGRMAGMPLGPLALADEVSVELIHMINRQTRADTGGTFVDPDAERVASEMVERLGRLGRKAGKGFYDYSAGGGKALWPGLAERFPAAPTQPAVDAVIERLIMIQSVEAARCLAEGVVTRPMDADIGALLGWGYPAFRGGPIGWIDTMGVASFVAAAERLAAAYGPRFAPPRMLEEMAAKGERFYSR